MKILIACGGTAGHIFPGLALAEEINKEKNDYQVTLVVSSRRRDQNYLKAAGAISKKLKVETIIAMPLPYKFSIEYLSFSLKLILAFFQALAIIVKFRPEVVVGFGGCTSFAPLVVASKLGIPTLIHEQNLVPGRTNKKLAKIVDKIAVCFQQTAEYFPKLKTKTKLIKTGLPLRGQILNRKSKHASNSVKAPSADKFTILIIGGSQGASKINDLVLDALTTVDKTTLAHLELIHLTGRNDFNAIVKRYETLGVAHQVFDFLEDMPSAYRVADLLISRSGAGAIFEAASFGLACILIPYSMGTQHQKNNAAYLKNEGAAIVLDERTTKPQDLARLIFDLIGNANLKEKLSRQIKLLAVFDAAKKLKKEVLDLHKGPHVKK